MDASLMTTLFRVFSKQLLPVTQDEPNLWCGARTCFRACQNLLRRQGAGEQEMTHTPDHLKL